MAGMATCRRWPPSSSVELPCLKRFEKQREGALMLNVEWQGLQPQNKSAELPPPQAEGRAGASLGYPRHASMPASHGRVVMVVMSTAAAMRCTHIKLIAVLPPTWRVLHQVVIVNLVLAVLQGVQGGQAGEQ